MRDCHSLSRNEGNLHMKDITYDQLNLYAYTGTAEDLKELLFKYGHDKNYVIAIRNGVEGEDNSGQHPYNAPAKDIEAKNKIMADFDAKIGDFAPQSAESKLAAEYNRIAKRVKELEEQAVEKDKTIEILRKNDRNNTYFPGH